MGCLPNQQRLGNELEKLRFSKTTVDHVKAETPSEKATSLKLILPRIDEKSSVVPLTLGLSFKLVDFRSQVLMELVNVLLSQGYSSRLINQLNHQFGLLYNLHGSTRYSKQESYLVFSTLCSAEHLNAIKEIMLENIYRLAQEKVSASELSKAKQSHLKRLEIKLGNSNELGKWLLHHTHHWNYQTKLVSDYQNFVNSITPGEILAFMKQISLT